MTNNKVNLIFGIFFFVLDGSTVHVFNTHNYFFVSTHSKIPVLFLNNIFKYSIFS